MKKRYLISMLSAMLMILLCFGLYQDQSFNTLNTADAQTGEAIVSNIEAVIVTNPNPIVVTNPNPVSTESSAACANSTQQIAVIWKNDIDQIENVKLICQDAQNNAQEQEIEATKRTKKAILFEKDFSGSAEGNYQLIGLKYRIKGSDEDQTFAFDDKKIDAEFTVTRLDAATAASQVQIEIEDLKTCETVVANGITDALRAMTDSAEENDPDTTGSKVVVLNPCHGGSDLGACANGLQEKALNLKIAQYCKAELETYEGVTVYMTRTDDTEWSSDDIIQFAADKDADLLISIHNNAGSGKTAKVYYPESKNDALDLSVQEENVSDNIWSQLDDLELDQSGSKILDNERGVHDYAVNKRAEESGFCAFIIDHTLVDEAGDADNFLDSDENLQKLGIADATGIADYFGLKKKQVSSEPPKTLLAALSLLNTGTDMSPSGESSDSQPVTVTDGVYVFSSALDNDMVMSVSTAAINNGANVQLGRFSDTQSQYFRVTSLGDGYYSIVNVFSGKSLDVCWGSSSSGANLWQYGANVTRAQKWRFYSTGDGNYTIVSALGTVIDVAGAGTSEGNNIWMYASNGTDAQKWTLTPVDESKCTKNPVEDGIYVFHSALDNNKAMDISGASMASGANVQLWDSNNTQAQFFKVKYLGDGYYSITNVKSNKSLDVCAGSNASGANLWQYVSNGTNAQKWRFYGTGDGNYTIVSALGTVIDVAGGGTSSGNNIWMYKSNGTNAQKWKLTEVVHPIVVHAGDIGVDVSEWQGDNINWSEVSNAGIKFAFLRCAWGWQGYCADNKDECFEQNYDGAKNAGIPIGIYLYSHATNTSQALKEAEYALSILDDRSLELPIVYDVEDSTQKGLTSTEITNIMVTFCNKIRSAGYTPMVYSYYWFLNHKVDFSQLNDCYIWMAHHNPTTDFPKRYEFWQYTSSGHINGIDGDVDLNRAIVDYYY